MNAGAALRDPSALDQLFEPRSVAIIGLSRSAIGAPISILTTLAELGFPGEIYVVNPSMEPTSEANVVSSLAEIVKPVDLAIVIVERARVLQALRDCSDKGIRAAIVVTQGFADADEEGSRLQREIVVFLRETGMRILGPNTLGVTNLLTRFTSSFIEVKRDLSPVGQVAQSGLFMMGHHLINNEPAGYCVAVDIGNACDVGLIDVIEYFEHNPNVRVIECHTEGVGDGRAFVETISRVSRSKPVIVLKAGTTAAGQSAVASHTGVAAGEGRLYRTALRKAGAVQAESAEELRMLSKAFATYSPPRGRKVAIMTFSGGGAILAIDALEKAGLSLASLSPSTRERLQTLFPAWMEVSNPVDIWMPVSKDFERIFPLVLEQLLEDDGVDAVLCIYCSYTQPKYARYDVSRFIGAVAGHHPEKPVLCWSYGLDIEGVTKALERDGNAMVFPSLPAAATAMARLAEYGEYRNRATPKAPTVAGAVEGAEDILAQGRSGSHLFTEGLELLELYGLALPPWRIARNTEDLVAVARELSFPLCLKAVSPDILHKSDGGGVRLGIPDQAALVRAATELRDDVRRKMGCRDLQGLLVQEMARRGKEVMIGGKWDATFGPCVLFGAGGIYTELFEDYAFRLAPITEEEAREMVAETRISRLLNGVRGEPPCDIDGVVDALLKVSRLISAHPRIKEIDINPLIVGEDFCVAVDARVLL